MKVDQVRGWDRTVDGCVDPTGVRSPGQLLSAPDGFSTPLPARVGLDGPTVSVRRLDGLLKPGALARPGNRSCRRP